MGHKDIKFISKKTEEIISEQLRVKESTLLLYFKETFGREIDYSKLRSNRHYAANFKRYVKNGEEIYCYCSRIFAKITSPVIINNMTMERYIVKPERPTYLHWINGRLVETQSKRL